MPVSIINTSKAVLSMTYNIASEKTTGDTSFLVTIESDEIIEDNEIHYIADGIFVFDPPGSVHAGTIPVNVSVLINKDLISLAEGDYQYAIGLTNSTAVDVVILVYLKVIDNSNAGDIERDYKLKYFFENKPSNDLFRCEIYEDKYLGPINEVSGKTELKYQDKSDHFQPIVASSVNITLNADTAVSFQDLYSEDEQNFKMILKRNGEVIFIGFLKPDGIWEDYVYDKWELSLDVFDGLSTLKNLSFSNPNGIPFSGKIKAFEIIQICLKKTGLDLPININCRLFYDGWEGNENTFDIIYLNALRYNQSNSEPMDCESVLKSILQLFNATLLQHKGEWFIYRTIDLNSIGTLFIRYADGLTGETYFLKPNFSIGSQINGFELFHCNANQKKSISPSVQAYRVTYQYGNTNSIFSNSELKILGLGLDIPGWAVENPDGKVGRTNNGYGLTSKTFTGSGDQRLITLNQSVDVNGGAVIKLVIRFGNYNMNSVGLTFAISVGGKFFNIESGQWQDSGWLNFVANYSFDGWWPDGSKKCIGLGDATYELIVQAPISGPLGLSIYRDRHPVGGGDFSLYSVLVQPNDSGNIKGREYTAQRTKRISTVTKPNITLYNGDSVSDLFVGTIYKNDGDTPTDKWSRYTDIFPPKELLSINAEDNLRIAPRPMTIFEGDVYGYLPFLSYVTIDKLDDKKFQPTSYSFDTSTGITKLTSREFASDYLDGKDFTIDVKDNYGNETKVTIV